MIIIIIKCPCEIIILQIYDRNKYYIIEVPDIKGTQFINYCNESILAVILECLSIWFFLVNKCGHRNVLSKRQVWMSIFHIINFK